MEVRPVLYVITDPPGWRGYCTQHGRLPVCWISPQHAALDLLGHAAHHHSQRVP